MLGPSLVDDSLTRRDEFSEAEASTAFLTALSVDIPDWARPLLQFPWFQIELL